MISLITTLAVAASPVVVEGPCDYCNIYCDDCVVTANIPVQGGLRVWGDNVTVRDLRIANATNFGIEIFGSNTVVKNVHISDSFQGIFVAAEASAVLKNNFRPRS